MQYATLGIFQVARVHVPEVSIDQGFVCHKPPGESRYVPHLHRLKPRLFDGLWLWLRGI